MFSNEFKDFFKELGSEFIGFFKKYGVIAILSFMTIIIFLSVYTFVIDF